LQSRTATGSWYVKHDPVDEAGGRADGRRGCCGVCPAMKV
jgi:hypothetical protein